MNDSQTTAFMQRTPSLIATFAFSVLPFFLAAAAPAPDSPPLSPAESLAKIHVPTGYRVELAASEPLTIDPVAIDWDAAGRMWVVEMSDYPLGMDGNGQPGGRVRVLEDADGDGHYDKSTVFAEGLNFPNGILAWRDGIIVTAAPEILFLRDTDGDGRADTREVLVSGLTTGNQQLRANGLRWGLDGWVYCAAGGHHGNYGTNTKLKTRTGEVLVGSRDFRFRPDTGELEPESGPSQYGRNRDDWGRWFGTQNSRPLWHYVLPDHYLRRNPHIAAPDPTRQVVVPLNPKVWPASRQEKRFHSFSEAGHFTSACAGMIYRDELLFGKNLPGERHAFTCEPFHNLVQHNIVTDDGVSFAAHRDPAETGMDFFASEDRWCRPVMTRTGPDGALWVADMYRYMIEHPEWLPANGRAELMPHYRLGDDMGRIYRVFPANRPPRRPHRLDQLNASELVAALDSSNEWQRDKAHMLLVWRADKAAVAPLQKLAADSPNPLARLHALCVLDNLDALSPAQVVAALQDPHPGVRENALRLGETHGTAGVIAAAARLVDDPDPKVRLQLALSLGAWNDAAAGRTLGHIATAADTDSFTIAAVMSSAVPHLHALVDAAAAEEGKAMPRLAEPLSQLALALDDRVSLATLLTPVLTRGVGGFATAQFISAARFLDTLTKRKTSLATLAMGDDTLALLLRKAGGAGDDSIFAVARRVVPDESRQIPERAAAISLLARDPSGRADTLRTLAALLTPRVAGELQRAAILALSAAGDPSVPATLLANWPSFSPETRSAALEALLSREPWSFALLEHAQGGGAVALDVTQRARLLKHGSKRVQELASTIFTNSGGSRAKVVQQFQPALHLAGDAARGRLVFDRACVVCHKAGGSGGEVGPDLKSVASHPPEKILTNILDPSADVQPGYHAYQCELTDGTELYGLISAETGNSITFKAADGALRVVLRKDIATLRSANASLMPEGLETALTHQDMADIIQFLRHGPLPALMK
jgi:putative membrane-bound dehydrogenase-like protein